MKYLSNTAVGDFRGYKPRSTGDLGARDNDERYNIPKFTPERKSALIPISSFKAASRDFDENLLPLFIVLSEDLLTRI